jgi:hypothetical protein
MWRLWPELCYISRRIEQLEELMNVLDSLLLQRRLLWKHTDNEDWIIQSV